jgi:hypothetical protein
MVEISGRKTKKQPGNTKREKYNDWFGYHLTEPWQDNEMASRIGLSVSAIGHFSGSALQAVDASGKYQGKLTMRLKDVGKRHRRRQASGASHKMLDLNENDEFLFTQGAGLALLK